MPSLVPKKKLNGLNCRVWLFNDGIRKIYIDYLCPTF